MRYELYRRAVGVVTSPDGKVLLVREGADPYWILPGGGVERDETFEQACTRELEEELGLVQSVGPLCFVLENFFTFGERRIHELCLAFRVHVADADVKSVESVRLRECRFMTRDEWCQVPVLPRALNHLLRNETPAVQYYVNWDSNGSNNAS